MHQPRVEEHLEFLAPPGAFDSRRIFMVCWDSESVCNSLNARCSAEPECMLRFCSFCGDKLCPGTMNSACFSPVCRRAETGPHSHWLPGWSSCTQGHRFHHSFHWFSTESFQICSLNETFRPKELESASFLLGMCETSLKTFGKPNSGLARAGYLTAQCTFYWPQEAELDTQICINAPHCAQRNSQSKLISAIINLGKLCYPGDGSDVITQLGAELRWCSQMPFSSLQVMLVCKSAFHFQSVKPAYGQ